MRLSLSTSRSVALQLLAGNCFPYHQSGCPKTKTPLCEVEVFLIDLTIRLLVAGNCLPYHQIGPITLQIS